MACHGRSLAVRMAYGAPIPHFVRTGLHIWFGHGIRGSLAANSGLIEAMSRMLYVPFAVLARNNRRREDSFEGCPLRVLDEPCLRSGSPQPPTTNEKARTHARASLRPTLVD